MNETVSFCEFSNFILTMKYIYYIMFIVEVNHMEF